MMKVRLLNDGGFVGLEGVKFPATVEASVSQDGLFIVHFDEIMNLDGAEYHQDDTDFGTKYSFYADEVEVVDE